jgi:hypothetical protein
LASEKHAHERRLDFTDHKKGIALVATRMTINTQVIKQPCSEEASSNRNHLLTQFAVNSALLMYMPKNVELPDSQAVQVKIQKTCPVLRRRIVLLQSLSWDKDEENHKTRIDENGNS